MHLIKESKTMELWIFQTGEPIPSDDGNQRPMRAMNLARSASERGWTTSIWSSRFFHQMSRQRRKTKSNNVESHTDIILIDSPGYRSNVGVGRLIDHIILAWRLRSTLAKTVSRPDIAFIGFPPIEFAWVAVSWCQKRGIPCVLDVKDLWPTYFVEKLPPIFRGIGRIAFCLQYWLAKDAMRRADCVTGPSQSYLSWVRTFSRRPHSPYDFVFPLLSRFDALNQDQEKVADSFWVSKGVNSNEEKYACFVGNLSATYDFKMVSDAWALASRDGYLSSCKFIICGTGTLDDEVTSLCIQQPNFLKIGWVDYPQAKRLYELSRFAIAPFQYLENFELNIPNKIYDFLSHHLPVVTTLGGETEHLLTEAECGVGGVSTVQDWYEVLIEMFHDDSVFEQRKSNVEAFQSRHLDGQQNYERALNKISTLSPSLKNEVS